MAATDNTQRPWRGALVLAACALPGVLCTPAARAEEAPEQGIIAFKFSHYEDSQAIGSSSSSSSGSGGSGGHSDHDGAARRIQSARAYNDVSRASGGSGGVTGGGEESSTLKRMQVNAPSLYLLVPLGRQWSVEGSAIVDEVSGASPAYYTDPAGFGNMKDTRRAVDLKLTRYFDRQTLSLGGAHSTEHDYISNALSLDGTWATEDHNTTWSAGLGLTRDQINPTTGIVSHEHKNVRELQLGVTQAWSRSDLVQAMFTVSRGEGYFNDPYKLNDARPRQRNAEIALLRWNHALGDSTVKTSYRYYRDSYGIQAHTLELGWVKPMSGSTTLTPSVRYTTQSAANFYADPSSDASIYPGPVGHPTYFTADQRLAAWGSLGGGLRLDVQLDKDWSFDMRGEGFVQDSAWRLGGSGSPGLARFFGLQWQVGLSRKF